jgi:hypothetical protein
MATECQRNQCDNNPANSCIRIQRYSSMDSYNGRLLGDSNNNCAGHLASVVSIAADIRDSIYDPPETDSITSKPTPEYSPYHVSPTTISAMFSWVTDHPTVTPTKNPVPKPTPLPTLRPTPRPTPKPTRRRSTPMPTPEYCGNGICDNGEDCNTCPIDCPKGTIKRASCGNGVCEAGDGETYYSCPYDCRGDAIGSILCGLYASCAPACNAGDFSCTNIPRGSDTSCCGDGLCTAGENDITCKTDC